MNPNTLMNYLYSSLQQPNQPQQNGGVQQAQNAPSQTPVVPVGMNRIIGPGEDVFNQNVDNSLLSRNILQNQTTQIPINTQAMQAQDAAIADPKRSTDLALAGGALDGHEYSGLCQQYVDDQTGAKQRFPTAIDTWGAKVATGEAQTNWKNIKPGDVVEFAADSSNGGAGHAAIVDGNGNLNMATYSGITTIPMDKWVQATGQHPLGFYSPNK